jgi:hypothetical protein
VQKVTDKFSKLFTFSPRFSKHIISSDSSCVCLCTCNKLFLFTRGFTEIKPQVGDMQICRHWARRMDSLSIYSISPCDSL